MQYSHIAGCTPSLSPLSPVTYVHSQPTPPLHCEVSQGTVAKHQCIFKISLIALNILLFVMDKGIASFV